MVRATARSPSCRDRPTGQSRAARNVADHGPADQDLVGQVQQVLEYRQLAGRLGAAQHDHVRSLGPPGQPLERGDFRLHQVAGRVRQQRGQLGHAGVPPVHGTERVAHVLVGQGCQLAGEGGPLRVVMAGLTGAEAQVLQHGHRTGAEGSGHRGRGRAGRAGGQLHGAAQQLAQALSHRGEAESRLWPPARPAQMRADDHPGATGQQRFHGGQGRPDLAVVGDPHAIHGNVQVSPDQHPLAADRQVINASHGRHGWPGQPRARRAGCPVATGRSAPRTWPGGP